MSKFPAFHSIDTLSIDFSDSTSRNATIFGNGRNQVAITIKLSLLDKDGHAVPVPESVLREAVYLCDYRTGKKLPDNNFFYSKEKNDYCQAVSWGTITSSLEKSNDDNFTTVELYVSANGISDGKLISCGINIDDIGDVDTSENGTGNKLPNGDPYFRQNYVTVKALRLIDYGDKQNIIMDAGDFLSISSNLGWTSRTGNIFKEHTNGTSKRKFVKIHPAKETGQKTFKEHHIDYNIVTNDQVNTGNIVWKCGWNSCDNEDCFSLINGPGYPCAVIGRGASYNDYQINFWYSRNNDIHIEGQVYLESTSYYYRFCPYVNENHTDDKDDGLPTLLLYKFTMPDDADHQYQWHDVVHLVTVKVTDYYGNQGEFKLTFNDNDNFDIPAIV